MEPSQWGPAWVLSAVYFPAVPFEEKKKNVLLPYSSGKCHAILSCVGGLAATVVAEEGLQLWNSRRSDIGEKKRWMCKQYSAGSTVNAAQSDAAPRSNIKATANSKRKVIRQISLSGSMYSRTVVLNTS